MPGFLFGKVRSPDGAKRNPEAKTFGRHSGAPLGASPESILPMVVMDPGSTLRVAPE